MDSPQFDPLVSALLDGDHALAVEEVRRLSAAGIPAQQVVSDGLEIAMERVDGKCTIEHFNLLEIMLVGRAVTLAAAELFPQGVPADQAKASVVLATAQGDVHDLGKNIVKMVLLGHGYRVIDLGRDCPVASMVAAAEREAVSAVLVSGLLTTIIPRVRELRPALDERGLEGVKIVAGGAALKQASAEQLNVDYVGQTAFDGVRFLDTMGVAAR